MSVAPPLLPLTRLVHLQVNYGLGGHAWVRFRLRTRGETRRLERLGELTRLAVSIHPFGIF